MQHLDQESISLAAINDSLDVPSQEHLSECESCTAEVRDLNLVVAAARFDVTGARLETPAPEVWQGIHRELGLEPALRPDPLTARRAAAAPSTDGTAVHRSDKPADKPVDSAIGRPDPRRFTARFLVAAAAAGVLTAAAAFWAAQMLGVEASPGVVAQAQLDPLSGSAAPGSATVVRAGDGGRTLEITLADEQVDGYREVWLIEPGLEQMYSLGVLGDGTSSLVIPDGVDLAAFSIVDVSDEPLDGNPVHSGVSVLRGSLEAATG